jgi:indole-3-glycerol phosphate synthase
MILDEIVRRTRDRVASLPETPAGVSPRATLSLAEAIARAPPRNAVIAELKLSSPTLGNLRSVEDLEWLAGEAVRAGSTALSVLTEPHFFGGSTRHLERVRRIADVPILRKDFIIDPRQLHETRALVADAVLLIAGLLGERLGEFVKQAEHLSLVPLVEVHSEEEVDLAIASVPEVESVVGKIGRAESATDPAPVSMYETTITLQRDKGKWRRARQLARRLAENRCIGRPLWAQ